MHLMDQVNEVENFLEAGGHKDIDSKKHGSMTLKEFLQLMEQKFASEVD